MWVDGGVGEVISQYRAAPALSTRLGSGHCPSYLGPAAMGKGWGQFSCFYALGVGPPSSAPLGPALLCCPGEGWGQPSCSCDPRASSATCLRHWWAGGRGRRHLSSAHANTSQMSNGDMEVALFIPFSCIANQRWLSHRLLLHQHKSWRKDASPKRLLHTNCAHAHKPIPAFVPD